MAASDHVNPAQLRMFMQAKELMDMPARDVYDGREPPYEGQPMTLWDDDDARHAKLDEAESKGLLRSVRRHGVKKPVHLEYTHPYLGDTTTDKRLFIVDGHHRVVSANDVDPDMYVPVKHFDDLRNI